MANPNEYNIKDEEIDAASKEYEKLDDAAERMSEKLCEDLVKDILKNPTEENNITVVMLAMAKSLTRLTTYFYDTQDEFMEAIKKARAAIPADIIPALLDPKPCGNCEQCKNGHEENCIAPVMRVDHTESRFLPILADMLIEYDLFNKVLWVQTVGKDNAEKQAAEELKAEEEKKNGSSNEE